MHLKLYHYWRSSSSWRVRWALAIKGLSYEPVAVSLLNGESEGPSHRTRNPLGFVPVLEVTDTNGTRSLIESIAILEWLEETHPENPLYPGDAWNRALIRQFVEIINADTQPLQNLPAQELHSLDPENRKSWARHWILQGLQAYETLAQRTAGRYTVGDDLSAADLCLIPQVYNAKRYQVDLAPFPTIRQICLNAEQTESWKQSEPERFNPDLPHAD
jgi:maleylacetoacetate isomerase